MDEEEVMLEGHMTKHKGYECTICKKRLKCQGYLNNHIQRHHMPDLFSCQKINNKFTEKKLTES